jgi:hypothetical protein
MKMGDALSGRKQSGQITDEKMAKQEMVSEAEI